MVNKNKLLIALNSIFVNRKRLLILKEISKMMARSVFKLVSIFLFLTSPFSLRAGIYELLSDNRINIYIYITFGAEEFRGYVDPDFIGKAGFYELGDHFATAFNEQLGDITFAEFV